ncbi:acyl-CoA dehydrogenase family protein [Nonomuraea sp. NBC_01738]|uniref:acyl-CoA dehydrogenase family protein n=1 Tax=Nonomuraea sp. NBC_01738 TaxID=2976003 RepID=UPI002E1550DD|nr:acyl-CoA dehydrogenase family protein [Nonomuraea sp. NBC_01738]
MNFAFTDDQLALAATVRDVLRAHCPPSSLRTDRTPAWAELDKVGLFSALSSDGAELVDLIPALEETGRACLPGPVAETMVTAAGGRCSVGYAGVAADLDVSDFLVIGERVVPVGEVRPSPLPGADPCRRLFAVEDGAPAVPVLAALTVAISAQLLGVTRHLLDTSVAYARTRTQFGSRIGAFQAVKHQLADVAIAADFAAPLVYRAALTRLERDVSAAKAASGEAATLAARTALQVHGAIGYTHELDLRFWLARAWSLAAAYGGSAHHRALVRASFS